jgi:hypothetical protein
MNVLDFDHSICDHDDDDDDGADEFLPLLIR